MSPHHSPKSQESFLSKELHDPSYSPIQSHLQMVIIPTLVENFNISLSNHLLIFFSPSFLSNEYIILFGHEQVNPTIIYGEFSLL